MIVMIVLMNQYIWLDFFTYETIDRILRLKETQGKKSLWLEEYCQLAFIVEP